MRVVLIFHPNDLAAAKTSADRLRRSGHTVALKPYPLTDRLGSARADGVVVLRSPHWAPTDVIGGVPASLQLVDVTLDNGLTEAALAQLDGAFPPVPGWRRQAGLVAGWLIGLGLIAAGLGVHFGGARLPLPAHSDAQGGGTAVAGSSAPDVSASEDAAALRALLQSLPEGAQAEAVRQRLLDLDAQALATISAMDDPIGRLAALTALEADGPQPAAQSPLQAQKLSATSEIAAAELALVAAGLLDPALADGAPDAATRAAITALQTRLGLPKTGTLDRQTTTALTGLSQAPAPPAAQPPVPEPLPSPSPAVEPGPPAATTIPAPGTRFQDCPDCPTMVMLPQGSARIGDDTGTGDVDERPVRLLTLDYPLAVSLTEVTVTEWALCVADGGCSPLPLPGHNVGPGRPAAGVSLSQGRAFVRWLRAKTGKPYRLLSEAEWEFAARGGSSGPFGAAAGPADLCRIANGADAASPYPWRNPSCTDPFPDGPASVRQFAPNGFGLYDMTGNLWEWVEDCWHPSYAGAPTTLAAWTTGCMGAFGVLRGGAYSVDPAKLRVSYRFPHSDQPLPFFGLRIARTW